MGRLIVVDPMGLAEVAAYLGLSKPALTNARRRRADFPAPRVELACGPIWAGADIRRWAK